jgi:hypothetical protein
VAAAVWQVAVLRAFAWVSRGLRSPARDILLTSLAARGAWGGRSGWNVPGTTGAVAGPLIASALVAAVGVRHAILLSVVPGLVAAVAITVAAREARGTAIDGHARRTLRLNLHRLRAAGLGRTLTPVLLFELGNLATTLLILRATGLLSTGARTSAAAASAAILLYAAHNAIAAAAALGGGRAADWVGGRAVLGAGASAYVAAYGLFAAGPHGWPALLLALCAFGDRHRLR